MGVWVVAGKKPGLVSGSRAGITEMARPIQAGEGPFYLLWCQETFLLVILSFPSECWTVKKAECRRIDAFELWCWRRLLRVPWTARRSNQSILEINPGISLEGMMLKLKLQYFGHLM